MPKQYMNAREINWLQLVIIVMQEDLLNWYFMGFIVLPLVQLLLCWDNVVGKPIARQWEGGHGMQEAC